MKKDNKHICHFCCGCTDRNSGLAWGIFFLILGGYFLLQELDLIALDISIWPVALLAFGAYLLIVNIKK